MNHGTDTYDECVELAKKYVGEFELWIFEDTEGRFHAIRLVDGRATFNHYVHTNKWIPRGRVFTETRVTTMWTGGVILE